MSDILNSPSKKSKQDNNLPANSTQVPVSLTNNNYPNSPLFDFDLHSPMYFNNTQNTSIPATPLSQLPFPSQIPNSRDWSPSIKIGGNMPENFSFPDTMSPPIVLQKLNSLQKNNINKDKLHNNTNPTDGIAMNQNNSNDTYNSSMDLNNIDLVQQLALNKKILSDRIKGTNTKSNTNINTKSNNIENKMISSTSNSLKLDDNHHINNNINNHLNGASSSSLLFPDHPSIATSTDSSNILGRHYSDYDDNNNTNHVYTAGMNITTTTTPSSSSNIKYTTTNTTLYRSNTSNSSKILSTSGVNTSTSSSSSSTTTAIAATSIILDDDIIDVPPNSPMPGLAAITAAAEALPLPAYHSPHTSSTSLIGNSNISNSNNNCYSPSSNYNNHHHQQQQLGNSHSPTKKMKTPKYNSHSMGTTSSNNNNAITNGYNIHNQLALLGDEQQQLALGASYSVNMEKFLSSKTFNIDNTSSSSIKNNISSMNNNHSASSYGTPNITSSTAFLLPSNNTGSSSSSTISNMNHTTMNNSTIGSLLLSENHRPVYVSCNCKRSRCLKMYCDCFRFTLFCKEACRCVDCANLEIQSSDKHEERNIAINSIVERNPEAFKPKVTEDVHSNSKGHLTGCHCRRSACLKKYCECYTGKVPCGDRCRCIECKNIPKLYENTSMNYAIDITNNDDNGDIYKPNNKLSDTESEAAEVLISVLHSPSMSRAVSLTNSYRDPVTTLSTDTDYYSSTNNNDDDNQCSNNNNMNNNLNNYYNFNGINSSNGIYSTDSQYIIKQTGLTDLKQQLHIDSETKEFIENANLFISPDHSNFNSPIKHPNNNSTTTTSNNNNDTTTTNNNNNTATISNNTNSSTNNSTTTTSARKVSIDTLNAITMVPRSPIQSLLDLAGICELRGVEEELQKSTKK